MNGNNGEYIIYFHFSPPSPEKLKKAREKRLKEFKMKAALKEIFTFFAFLILLINVAYYHRDPNTFFLTKTLFETFEEVDAFSLDLGTVCIRFFNNDDTNDTGGY